MTNAIFAACTSSAVKVSTNAVVLTNPFEDSHPVFIVTSETLNEISSQYFKFDHIIQSTLLVGITTLRPDELKDAESDHIFERSRFIKGRKLLDLGSEVDAKYGFDLKDLSDGDYVKLNLTEENTLEISVNGINVGQAFEDLPSAEFYPIIGMLGKKVRMSIPKALTIEDSHSFCQDVSSDLKFSSADGASISNESRTASKIVDDYKAVVVNTDRPLKANEIFEVKIDTCLSKWSGALEIGIRAVDCLPGDIEFVNLRGADVYSNLDIVSQDYSPINVDQLSNGDVLGVRIGTEGYLHFCVNGIDLGALSSLGILNNSYYGSVKLYGKTKAVTLVSGSGDSISEIANLKASLVHSEDTPGPKEKNECNISNDVAQISPNVNFSCSIFAECVQISTSGNSIERIEKVPGKPRVFLDTNLIVERKVSFRIDKIDETRTGSPVIGLAPLQCGDLAVPLNYQVIAFSTRGIIFNGNGIATSNLQLQTFLNCFANLEVGAIFSCHYNNDKLTLSLDDYSLAYSITYKKTAEQKLCAFIELSGRCIQLSIISPGVNGILPVFSPEDMKPLSFHCRHGHNCKVEPNRITAYRPNPESEFSDAILMSNRVLADNEMFEISIDSIISMWSGSLEIGLTTLDPDKVTFPKTMTLIMDDIWLISGSAVIHNGDTIWNDYGCDFDKLGENSTVGVMRASDATMHIFVDGIDQGIACVNVPDRIYAIVDLYGQCQKVTILHPDQGALVSNDKRFLSPSKTPKIAESHKWAEIPVSQLNLSDNNTVASKANDKIGDILFSEKPISPNEVFSFHVSLPDVYNSNGSLKFGFTDCNPNLHQSSSLSFAEMSKNYFTCYWFGSDFYVEGQLCNQTFSPNLEILSSSQGAMFSVSHLNYESVQYYFNDYPFSSLTCELPSQCFVFVEFSSTKIQSLTAVSRCLINNNLKKKPRTRQANVDCLTDNNSNVFPRFHRNCGINIQFTEQFTAAKRTSGYKNGLVISKDPLVVGKAVNIKVYSLDEKFENNFSIGCISANLEKYMLPSSAQELIGSFSVADRLGIIQNGLRISSKLALSDIVQESVLIGVLLDSAYNVHLLVNNLDYGILRQDTKQPCYAIFDLNGSVSEIFLQESNLNEVKTYMAKENLAESSKSSTEKEAIATCPYMQICKIFKETLKIPKQYFRDETENKNAHCYCEICNKQRATETCFKQGEPVKPFTLPENWCKFNLKVNSEKRRAPDYSTWQIAHNCPQRRDLRKIFEKSELLVPTTENPNYFQGEKAPSKVRDTLGEMILLSPTVNYCSQDEFCHSLQFVHEGKGYSAKLALQVWIKPGSYTAGCPSINPNKEFDSQIPLCEHEWLTKESGATFVSALLVKLTTE